MSHKQTKNVLYMFGFSVCFCADRKEDAVKALDSADMFRPKSYAFS